jgi:hypothetical protein
MLVGIYDFAVVVEVAVKAMAVRMGVEVAVRMGVEVAVRAEVEVEAAVGVGNGATDSSAASRSSLCTCSRASRTAFLATNRARSASRSAASAFMRDCFAVAMDGSPEPRLNIPEVRVVEEVEVRCVGDGERRRENIPCFCGGGGGGEGSRLDPKSGMLIGWLFSVSVVCWRVVVRVF